MAPAPSLAAVALRFLRLGAGAWGGPFVQIAALQDELVRRERWCDEAAFRRALALYQALPGPEATEMCIWLGSRVRGRLGGLCAGLGFVLPGLVLMLLVCWLLHGQPASFTRSAAFVCMQAAVVALVVRAAWRLAAPSVRSGGLGTCIVAGAAGGELLGVPFVVSLLGGGLVATAARAVDRRFRPLLTVPVGVAWAAAAALALWLGADAATATPHPRAAAGMPLADLFLTGLRAGALTFGGAYTVIPFLQADAVGGGWLTQQQFLDGLAFGSVLPAPMVIVGTWVGWAGGGDSHPLAGALLTTLGIFLPAFVLPLLLHDRLDRLLANARWHALFDGVTAAVVGIVAVVAARMAVGLATLPRTPGESGPGTLLRLGIAAAALVALATLRGRHTIPAVVLAAAATGWLTA